MQRICPKCGNNLELSDNFFCSSCGEKIPSELILPPSSVRIKKYRPTDKSTAKPNGGNVSKKLLNKKLWAALGLVIVIGFAGFYIASSGIISLIVQETTVGKKIETTVTKIVPTEPRKEHQLSLNLSVPSSSFGKVEFPNHIPSDVDFYFEGTNLTELMKSDLFDLDNDDLRNAAKVLLEPEFAGFAFEEDNIVVWGFIFVPKDIKITQDVLGGKIGNYWKLAFIDDYMLLTNSEELFDKVKSVDGNLIIPLSKNPEFLTLRKELLLEGQFQVYFLSERSYDLVRSSLGGLNQATIGMINEVLNSKKKNLVISNNNE